MLDQDLGETLAASGTPFTAHNIRLDDGSLTYPAADWTMDQSPILLACARILRLVFPGGLAGRSLADIGCLEGGFATEFARLGMHATGIEVRPSNFANCLRVKQGVNLADLHFVHEDAMNIGRLGEWDCVFACGLLYHLDQPRRFIEDAASVCRHVMLIDTHVAPASDAAPANAIHKLSPMTENEGLRGRWYVEYDKPDKAALDKMKWASWSNSRSFWLEKASLAQLLRDCGFSTVCELFDVEGEIAHAFTDGWRATHSRVLMAAIR